MLFGCGIKHPPKAIILPQPKPESSVIPQFKKVDKNLDDIIKGNKDIDDNINKQKKEISDQKIKIEDLLSKIETIKSELNANPNRAITEKEINDLITGMKNIQTKNTALETEVAKLVDIRKRQESDLNFAKINYNDALNKLVLKEKEVDSLRVNGQYLEQELKKGGEEIEKLKGALSKEKITSAKSSVYRNWILGAVGVLILGFGINAALKVYFPFRG